MHRPAWRHLLVKPGTRLAAVFAVFVLLPGMVLGVFALRTLRQERLLAQHQAQERLQSIVDRAGRELTSEFRQWQASLPSIARGKGPNFDSLPETVRHAIASPGAGVVVWQGTQGFGSLPPGQLLYLPSNARIPQASPKPLSAAVTLAESVELVKKDYPEAIRLYRSLLNAADAELRPLVLQRLARSYRKSGLLDDAVSAYREFERSRPVDGGPLPASLIARSELCSIAAERGRPDELAENLLLFYRDLAGGRWLIEKMRYLYYSDCCRSWSRECPDTAAEFAKLAALEEAKLDLTRAVEELLAKPRVTLRIGSHLHLAFWQPDPFAAIVFSSGFLESHLWPRIFSIGEDRDYAAALHSPDGTLAFGSAPEVTPSSAVMINLRMGESRWQLQMWPRHADTFYSDVARRQNAYVAMLIFAVAFLIFGSFLTLRTARRELEIARMRADFVSTVSHEFRSPLTGIRQLGEMLLDGRVRSEERQRRYYRMIVRESERLGRLVENILNFSRMQEGRKHYRFASLDTAAWLRRLVDDFRSEVTENGVSIHANIPEALPLLAADGEALGCAVHNLLDNAVKYSPNSKTVWLEARAEKGGIRISVRDQGVGIPERDQKYIFDKFYRVDGAISQKVKGAGLGLSLVKHIVAAHGGTVECESRLGAGSTFSILVPFGPPAAGGESREHAAHPGG